MASEVVNKSTVHPDRCVTCSLAPRLSNPRTDIVFLSMDDPHITVTPAEAGVQCGA